MEWKGRMEIRKWVKGNGLREWSPPWVLVLCPDGCSSRQLLHRLLQEFAEQWVIKLVSSSSRTNQQPFFSQAREIFCLEF